MLSTILILLLSLHALCDEKKYTEKEVEEIVERRMKQDKNDREFRKTLSPKDQKIFDQGEMSNFSYYSGGIAGTYLGFGIGHSIQGRYAEKGWIFSLGEGISIITFFNGALTCAFEDQPCTNDALTIGTAGFIAFRVWEIVDLWLTPYLHERRYRELKKMQNNSHISFAPFYNSKLQTAGMGIHILF